MLKKSKKIIFRADASATIGYGHFYRLMALAEMLQDFYICVFATRLVNDLQRKEIYESCEECIELPQSNQHYDNFLNYLTGSEIVVLDNYFFSSDYQLKIKNKGCKLVCVDDLHDKHFYADIVINPANNISKSDYSLENYTHLLHGYRYLLLRKPFLIDIQPSTKKYSCLLMIGGSDPYNLTNKFLQWLKDYTLKKPIAIIIGAGYQFELELNNYSNYEVFSGITATEVAKIMLSSEIGILPASTSALEACALRLPLICGYFIDNQKDSYKSLLNAEIIIAIDNLLTTTEKQFYNALNQIHQDEIAMQIKNNQIKHLDLKFKDRFIEEFRLLCI